MNHIHFRTKNISFKTSMEKKAKLKILSLTDGSPISTIVDEAVEFYLKSRNQEINDFIENGKINLNNHAEYKEIIEWLEAVAEEEFVNKGEDVVLDYNGCGDLTPKK